MQIFNRTFRAMIDSFIVRRASVTEIEKRQKLRMEEIITYAREFSPFYKELYSGLPQKINSLSGLPPVTKSQIKKSFDYICTDPSINHDEVEKFISNTENVGKAFLDKYFVCNTAGTTGNPEPFISDDFTVNIGSSITRIRGGLTQWYGLRGVFKLFAAGARYALLDIKSGHFSGIASLEWYRREHPQAKERIKLISIFDKLEKQVQDLNRYDPAAIGGYPSSIVMLAREKLAGRLKIKPVFIILVGELVTKNNKNFIEQIFGCTVYEEYGSTENNVMAVQCREGWLHYSSDWFVLEPVDQDLNAVPNGEVSHTVLITNLMNKVMPLIRYDQGDSVLFKPEPCSCGNVFPAMKVMGRREEMITLLAKDGNHTSISPLILVEIAEGVESVLRAQITQKSSTILEIRLLLLPIFELKIVWTEICDRLNQYFEEFGIMNVQLKLSFEPPKQNLVSGKYPLVIKESKLKTQENIKEKLYEQLH